MCTGFWVPKMIIGIPGLSENFSGSAWRDRRTLLWAPHDASVSRYRMLLIILIVIKTHHGAGIILKSLWVQRMPFSTKKISQKTLIKWIDDKQIQLDFLNISLATVIDSRVFLKAAINLKELLKINPKLRTDWRVKKTTEELSEEGGSAGN